MKVSNITPAQLDAILCFTNVKHDYRLEFNRSPEYIGKWVHFTIKSKVSKIRGARTSWTGRNTPSASWHAHGHLFEEILAFEATAVIKTAAATIDINGGNWQDYQIGSMMCPVMASEVSIFGSW